MANGSAENQLNSSVFAADSPLSGGSADMAIDLTSDVHVPVESTIAAVDIDTLRVFVPLNILSDDHLHTLARNTEIELLLRNHSIGDAEILKRCQIFLLSGGVQIAEESGEQTSVYAGAKSSHLSLGDRFGSITSLQALEDSQLLILDREKLDAMLCWDQVAKTLAVEFSADRQLDEDLEWMNTLLCSNLFHKIPPFNVKEIFNRFEPQVVHAGEAVVRQGEEGDICYIIKEGYASVSVERSGEDPVVVAQLGPGKCFGEDALLNKTTRNATVTMESNGVVMCLKKRDFLTLLSEPAVEALSPQQAEASVASGAQWLDVRSQQEFDNAHKENAFHLPMHLMSLKSRLMDANQHYIAYCSTGRRASTVAYLLSQQGFTVQALAQS